MLITAGLPAEHDWHDQFGIELDDLGSEHSLRADPTVVALWRAAGLLGDDNWIAARLPASMRAKQRGRTVRSPSSGPPWCSVTTSLTGSRTCCSSTPQTTAARTTTWTWARWPDHGEGTPSPRRSGLLGLARIEWVDWFRHIDDEDEGAGAQSGE